jgi:hypothetical protein
MPLDTSIPLQVRQLQFDDPQMIRAKGIQMRQLERGEAEAQRAGAERQTIRDLYRSNVGADGNIDPSGLSRGMAQAGLGDQIADAQKGLADSRKAVTAADEGDLNLHKKRLEILNGGLSALLAKPDVTHDDVIAQINNFVNQGIITPEQGAEAARNTPGRPEQLRPFLIQKALEGADAAKQLDTVLPQYNEQNRGGTINEGTVDRLTGQRTAGKDVALTATPGQQLAADTRTAAGVSFTDEEGSLMAALAERGISLPAGMRSRAQMKSTFASLLSRNAGMSPDDIAEKIATGQINFRAEGKETQTAAGVAGRVAVAVQELKTFGEQVRDASAAIPRGKFVPWNKLKQMTNEQLSDPELINLKVKMQALNNAYDQLAARGGTDAEKRAHIAQLFNTAKSPEGVEALVKAVNDEAVAAETAARKATQRRPHETTQAPGQGTGATEVLPSGATVSSW